MTVRRPAWGGLFGSIALAVVEIPRKEPVVPTGGFLATRLGSVTYIQSESR